MTEPQTRRYPLIPFADAGDVHDYLAKQGLAITGVSFDDSTNEIVIEGDDPTAHMQAITGVVEAKEQRRKQDVETVKTFLNSQTNATNAQLNEVLRAFMRIVVQRLKPVEL